MTTPPETLLITGTVGVGKTATASAVGELLAATGVPGAVLDLDWLRRCWPPPPDDRFNAAMTLRNLRDVAANYRAAGARRLILAGVIESVAERRRYADAVGGPLTVCRLHAPLPVIHERLRRRHRDEAETLRWHLHRSGELAAVLDAAALADVTVESAGPLPATARAVLDAAGW